MKKLFLLACAALLVAALKFDNLSYFRDRAQPIAHNVTLPFKLAMLAAQEPDNQIAVPVEDVGLKQIGDTWYAPRSGGRRHEGQDIFAKRGTAVRSATNGYVVGIGESPLGGKTVSVMGAGRRS